MDELVLMCARWVTTSTSVVKFFATLMSSQVINALNHIVEGQVCRIIIRDCSPVRSDSFYTTSDDDGESSEDEMNTSKGESECHNRESTLSSSNESDHFRTPNPSFPSIEHHSFK